ncbi:hypothetical protein CRUP_028591 [Coryphaenoides rupestris]|nr:hypothetical protein CRUP_028591 [Coryphaenoides rupestris]
MLSWDTGAERAPSRELWFANALHSGTGLVKEVEWRRLGELPDGPRFRHAVGVVRGRLHVVGGCNFYAPNDTMKSAYSYDPALDRWQRLADMQEARSSLSVVVGLGLGGGEPLLYAMGGDRQINTNLTSVEVYDQQSDSWSYTRPLDQPLSSHTAAHLAGDGILISGGFDRQYRCLASVFLYRPDGDGTCADELSLGSRLLLPHISALLAFFSGVVGDTERTRRKKNRARVAKELSILSKRRKIDILALLLLPLHTSKRQHAYRPPPRYHQHSPPKPGGGQGPPRPLVRASLPSRGSRLRTAPPPLGGSPISLSPPPPTGQPPEQRHLASA